MKKIEAIIRPEKLEPLRMYLEEIGCPGMMVTEIEGHGKQGGVQHQWRGAEYKTIFLPKIKLEIVVPDSNVKKICAGILEVCRSGAVGDGKIFISPVSDAIRIRTNEKGDKAIK
ncbi:MAG: P-II family nitrogen regulator [candidate division FCPU426 bacterium]